MLLRLLRPLLLGPLVHRVPDRGRVVLAALHHLLVLLRHLLVRTLRTPTLDGDAQCGGRATEKGVYIVQKAGREPSIPCCQGKRIDLWATFNRLRCTLSQMEHTLARMTTFLLILWILSWTPYTVMSVWIMFFQAEGLTPNIALLPTIMCKLSGALNGFIYGVRYEAKRVYASVAN